MAETLKETLKSLDKTEYLIIALFFVEGLTIEEIDYALGGIGKDKIKETLSKVLANARVY